MAANQRAVVELLFRVSRDVAEALDLRTVLTRLLFAAINNVGGERGSIVVLDNNTQPVDSAIVYGRQVHEHTTVQLRDTIDHGLAGWVVRNQKPVLIPDTSKDERWLRREDDAANKTGAKSAICVPLLVRKKLVGVLTLVHPEPNAYNEEQFELMQAIADQAGVAVLNARLYDESQRQARVMTALADASAEINTSLRLDEVFNRILQQTVRALDVEIAAIALTDLSSGDLVYCAATGEGADSLIGQRVAAGRGLSGKVMRDGQGVVVPSVTQEVRFSPEEQVAQVRIYAVAISPMRAEKQVIGIIQAINPVKKNFDPDALLVLNGLGSLAGTTLQNAQLFERFDAAQKRYRELFEDSIDPIVITDLDGKLIEVNRRAIELSGYNLDELRDAPISKLHSPNYEKTGQNFEKAAATSAITYETQLILKNEKSIPVEVYLRKVVFDDVASLQWMLRDITTRKELDSLRDDLMAMIYHDLRSPLSNIVSSLDILTTILPKQENDTATTVLEIARHSIERIQRLVNSLLDINRLEAGQPLVNRRKFQLKSIFDEGVEAIKPGLNGRNQTIAMEYPDSLPTVSIDVDMIRRVIINLMDNAVKYTPSKGQIEVGAASDGVFVRIWIKDNGLGIPSIDRERIFEKFARLKGENSPSGLGVGLAFCKLAIEAHGGQIWVESEPGQGAKFIFTLPIDNE